MNRCPLPIQLLLVTASILLASLATAETAVERGQAAAAVCTACHQEDGNGLSTDATTWPRLAGMDAGYLLRQLQLFQDGERVNAEMQGFAQMLNAGQMEDVAAYYASLPAKAPEAAQDFPDELLAKGEKLALQGDWDHYVVACSKCHGPGNQGIGSQFPGIAGQHANYISSQLHAWQDGTRKGDPQGLMHTIASHLDEQQIAAISAWLSTQPAANPDQE